MTTAGAVGCTLRGMNRRGELAPSVIAADFACLGEQLGLVERSASRWHIDVMDGHYVPNLTIGPMLVEAIGHVSKLPQDVHLMIDNPDDTWEWYAKAGASRIAFHPEVSADASELLRRIAGAGLGAGLAVNPDVSASEVESVARGADHLVVMSVYPGFSGQAFIPDVLPKFAALRDALGPDVQLIVDGGVNLRTARTCVEAGADVLVSASAIFGADHPGQIAGELLSAFDATG